MQVFSRRAVLLLKLAPLVLLGLLAGALAVGRWRSGPPWAVAATAPQPIPFSHKHHVGDDGIDCRYCHTTVETSRTAGLPSTDTCLSCHAQLYKEAPLLAALRESQASGRPIAWTRLHDLPDFAYFDHGIHVHKGVACAECHGALAQMPLTRREASLEMQWCLACHRAPQGHLHPAADVFGGDAPRRLDAPARAALAKAANLAGPRRLTDCSTCHR